MEKDYKLEKEKAFQRVRDELEIESKGISEDTNSTEDELWIRREMHKKELRMMSRLGIVTGEVLDGHIELMEISEERFKQNKELKWD